MSKVKAKIEAVPEQPVEIEVVDNTALEPVQVETKEPEPPKPTLMSGDPGGAGFGRR